MKITVFLTSVFWFPKQIIVFFGNQKTNNMLHVFAILITIAASFAYVNAKFIRLPSSIGLMVLSAFLSLSIIIAGQLGFISINTWALEFIEEMNFKDSLLVGMLGYLLFSGSLEVDLTELLNKKWEVLVLSTLGVIISTITVGVLMYVGLYSIGLHIDFIYCLIFGALISPTDPVSVLSILKSVGAPKELQITIAGESLFNDGVGIVLFLILCGLSTGDSATPSHVVLLFGQEALGGAALGLILGYVAYKLLEHIDDYKVEVLITIALVTGEYALAEILHTSGAIATVVSGLFIGNKGRWFAMSETTREHLDNFWELVDDILNSLLFVMIGFELVAIQITEKNLIAGILAITVVIVARFISVAIPAGLFELFKRKFSRKAEWLLTWGGLRGGIPIALVLTLPASIERELLLTITYMVVAFSVFIQGSTTKTLVKKLFS